VLLLALITPAAAAQPKAECADRIDNDGDGFVDYSRKGGDPDCTSRKDTTEGYVFKCTDADGDGTLETPPPLPNAAGRCDFFTGEVSLRECTTNFYDLNGIVVDGCEYGPITATGPEVCDGIDNDADGAVDEGITPPEVANGFVSCREGAFVVTCDPGFVDANSELSDGCEAIEPEASP
ncbi:MAG: hypothetical protein M3313_12830, partial [Actinomycetota bacterium]|nr:hypothetical protein [Actinomycetota bacterium]